LKLSDNVLTATRTDTNVQGNISVTASFAIDTHIVTPSVTGNGSINPNAPQTITDGSTTSFLLTPAAGNHIVDVTSGCGGSLTGNSFTTGAVTADCSVVANFAVNPPELVFTVQPGSLTQGDMLGSVQVTEKDSITGAVIADNASVDFTTVACSGSLDLGSVQMTNGVATLNSTQRFYVVASGKTVSATSGSLNTTSTAFNISANAGLLFSNGFEGCRP